jgi:hypothetical protein
VITMDRTILNARLYEAVLEMLSIPGAHLDMMLSGHDWHRVSDFIRSSLATGSRENRAEDRSDQGGVG